MIELICLDVDGTLTDGKLYYSDSGMEMKAFNVHDGLGIACWLKLDKKIALISGRDAKNVRTRAQELGITECFLGIRDKKQVVLKLMEKYQLQSHQIACIGDDLNDLPMFAMCGMSFVPADAAKIMHSYAKYILTANGGEGAVREMIDFLIVQEKLEGKVLEFFTK
ncbi:KdsC family phosphatase [Helicobacter anatolicus]|uniref:KdsC family phosphatase n=1 Tax=Helicobacter anatolicus TaxID=2905874 RepID=UPI001E4247AA|nr:HAD hydrolase family protein [Helicobacter anatolicus]MCE3040141.1 HAD hydrolase family protein [Helicobacter anatolicus]